MFAHTIHHVMFAHSCGSPYNDTVITCSEDMTTLLNEDGYCNLITRRDGVFGECSIAYMAAAGDFWDTCRFDVCANTENLARAKMAACRNLEAFAKMCAELGYVGIDWRGVANCRKHRFLRPYLWKDRCILCL